MKILENLKFRTVSSTGHVRSLLRRASLGIWANRSCRCVHLAELCGLGFYFASFGRRMTLEICPKVRTLPFSDCGAFCATVELRCSFCCEGHLGHYWGLNLTPGSRLVRWCLALGTSEATLLSSLFLLRLPSTIPALLFRNF